MSNSIGPCPTELDTLDSNIGAALALAAAGRPRRRRHMRFPVISRSCIKPERGVGSVFVCDIESLVELSRPLLAPHRETVAESLTTWAANKREPIPSRGRKQATPNFSMPQRISMTKRRAVVKVHLLLTTTGTHHHCTAHVLFHAHSHDPARRAGC